jgi:hypothetical protein
MFDEEDVDKFVTKSAKELGSSLEADEVKEADAVNILTTLYGDVCSDARDFIEERAESALLGEKRGFWFEIAFGLLPVGSFSTSSMKGLAFWDFEHDVQHSAHVATGSLDGIPPLRFGSEALDKDMFSQKPVWSRGKGKTKPL